MRLSGFRPLLWRLALSALATVGVVCAVVLPADGAAAASNVRSGKVCFEAGDAKWAKLRSMADQFAQDGTISRATAEAYKCDPRLSYTNMVVRVSVEPPIRVLSLNCNGYTGNIIASIGIPTTFTATQSLRWCFDGTLVSNWSGTCDGNVTGWGTAQGWDWDGCTTDNYIPYTLNGHYPGGVHHYTKHHFTTLVPWVPNYTQAISTWGHFDGTADYAVY